MVRVHAFPREGFYGDCLYGPLESVGITVLEGRVGELEGLGRGDIVHLHWPALIYAQGVTRWQLAVSYFRFLRWLCALKQRGVRIFWTAHNLLPHEATRLPGADLFARRLLVRLADGVFVHGPAAEAVLLAAFPAAAGKTVLIEHGVMAGYYPAQIGRAEARARLGLGEGDFAYLFIGQWRPYKNLPQLISAVAELADDSLLILAGNAPARYRAEISALARDRLGDRVRIHPGRVADEQLQVFCRAADVAALPYREILTSGAAVLALSFGCPVVAPRRGHLEDLIDDANGVLFPIDEPAGLRDALRTARQRSFDRAAIEARMARASWADTAAITRAAYGI